MPHSFEKFFMPFDDALIRICQRFHSKPVQWFSKVVSAFSTIEIGMTVPFLCFFLGWDAAAQIWLSFALALAIIPQLPKRFIWRPRPYMAGRAKKFGKEHTSSFPSRAVTVRIPSDIDNIDIRKMIVRLTISWSLLNSALFYMHS